MTKINIGIYGPNGRMGKDIIDHIGKFSSLKLSILCEKKGHKSIGKSVANLIIEDDVENLLTRSDVVIDFTTPDATIRLLKIMDNLNIKKTALVTGTTGYTKAQEKNFKLLKKGKTILRSFNMSIGINLLKNLVAVTSQIIGDKSDIEINEIHHNKKKDSPSGTALSLADSILKGGSKKIFIYREKNNDRTRKKNEIGFSSIRGGDVIGEHSVFFFLDGERIELKHIASSRQIFSIGALEAARWIFKKKPGLYSLMDMVEA